jgi:hypothetical protein
MMAGVFLNKWFLEKKERSWQVRPYISYLALPWLESPFECGRAARNGHYIK